MMAGIASKEEYIAQAGTGALLNPRIDSTFKALFTSPTPESRGALRSFLEACTGRTVKSVELRPNGVPAEFAGQRGVDYDILCVFDDGRPADLEMQAFSRKYDYGKRAEYQVSRLETTYLKRGDGWEKAPEAYQITVLDFIYSSRRPGAVSRYAMRTEDGERLAGSLNVVFIELPKTRGLEAHLERNSALENWALFLKNADNPGKGGMIREFTEKEAGLMQAKESLSSISADQDLWLAQYRREVRERDRISSLTAARTEGRSEGITLGMERGRKAGVTDAARSMLGDGIPADKIARWTGLSAEEIARLQGKR